MSKLQIITEQVTAALNRLNGKASLRDIAMNMRENGFEFSRRLCINDLYVLASKIKGIRKADAGLYELIETI